jgi:hypothetical protein
MENINWLDFAFATAALSIVIGGLIMLFQGISAMEKKD